MMTTLLRAHEDTVKRIFYIQLVNKETDLTFLEDNFTICIKSLKGEVIFSGLLETEQCLKTMEELKMEKIANVTISIHPLVHIVDLGVTKICTNGPSPWLTG